MQTFLVFFATPTRLAVGLGMKKFPCISKNTSPQFHVLIHKSRVPRSIHYDKRTSLAFNFQPNKNIPVEENSQLNCEFLAARKQLI